MWDIEGKEQMLACTKSVLEHTCFHDMDDLDEHLEHASDLAHIRDEVEHVIKHLKHIQRALCQEVYSKDNEEMWDLYHDMIEEARDLHADLRDPEHHNVASYKAHLMESIPTIHRLYDKMVDHVEKHSGGTITKEMKEFFKLAE